MISLFLIWFALSLISRIFSCALAICPIHSAFRRISSAPFPPPMITMLIVFWPGMRQV